MIYLYFEWKQYFENNLCTIFYQWKYGGILQSMNIYKNIYILNIYVYTYTNIFQINIYLHFKILEE